jgi:hypothetical protein
MKKVMSGFGVLMVLALLIGLVAEWGINKADAELSVVAKTLAGTKAKVEAEEAFAKGDLVSAATALEAVELSAEEAETQKIGAGVKLAVWASKFRAQLVERTNVAAAEVLAAARNDAVQAHYWWKKNDRKVITSGLGKIKSLESMPLLSASTLAQAEIQRQQLLELATPDEAPGLLANAGYSVEAIAVATAKLYGE